MTKKEYILDFLKEINYAYNHPAMYDDLKRLLDEMEEEILESVNCISREEVLNVLKTEWTEFDSELIDYLIEKIDKLPPATAQPKMGYWFIDERPESDREVVCSNCDKPIFKYHKLDFDYRPKYCPNCGAKMQEVKNETNN